MSQIVHKIIVSLVLTIYLAGSLGSSNNTGDGEPQIMCKEAERLALLKMKEHFRQLKLGALSSWSRGEEEEGNTECCEWIGIRCDNTSGHVIGLDLSPSTFDVNYFVLSLRGNNISTSSIKLENLNYLDLSSIDFDNNPIPSVISTFTKLRYLNLSGTNLNGEVPPQFGNLSSLRVLDLDNNKKLEIKNLEWASHLSSLQILDLSSANMSSAHDWVRVINNLPSLTTLVLSDCHLPDSISPHLSLSNPSKALSFLDLSENYNVSASIFQWLSNYSRALVHLDLSACSISTTIPDFFRSMYSLRYLDLDGNQFKGSIPSFFANMTSLTYLSLADNQFEGYIPEMFGNMSSLEHLSLSSNMLDGEIPKTIWQICTLEKLEAYGNNLSGELHLLESSSPCPNFPLKYLDLSGNRLSGSVPNFTLYPSLVEVKLGSNQLNGNISKSIGQLPKLEVLDVSGNNISTVMSEDHFSKLLELDLLDLSSNSHIVFNVPSDWKPPFQLSKINLHSCTLGPHFPQWLRTQTGFSELDISKSGISDPIPSWFWNISTLSTKKIYLSNNEIGGTIQDDRKLGSPLESQQWKSPIDIDLSSNQLEGPIPAFLLRIAISLDLSNNHFTELNSICNLRMLNPLKFIDVSSNRLTGELPDCWSDVKTLEVLRLENNKLTGKIPLSIGFLTQIWSLHLSNNSFTAELPLSLKNLTRLKVLNVAENNLSENFPTWIAKELPNMVVLSLRSNNFYGKIPSELCHLQDLQVLDLSSNSLSGSIPTCLGNITAMKKIGKIDPNIVSPGSNIYSRENHRYYSTTNKPKPYNDRLHLVWKGTENEFKNLGLLKNIDFSSNKLVGEIPSEITELIGLNSLNLSRNNLSGKIPQNIGQLESLDVLDLSRNHLFGQIPPSLSQINRLGVLDLSSNNLSGEIPPGTQLQRRDAASYADNPELCGAPLPKNCSVEPNPRGTTKGDNGDEEDQDDLVTKGFYICAVVGFIVGFWGFCGTLIFHKSLRYRYLKFLESKGEWLYVIVMVHKAKLLRIIKS